MPGGRIAKGARGVLPKKAQRQFAHVVQSMESSGHSGKVANQAAWSVVHQGYKPGKSGKWVKRKK
jgi:cation transport regulator ChaB